MSQRNPLQVQISDEQTKEWFEELRDAVASELGVHPRDLARWEVVREAAEAYAGGDALGGWRE